MELNEFVSKTLIEIINGVKNAQSKHGELVNPPVGWVEEKKCVSFDVAVTVEEKQGKGGEAKINVFGSKAGGTVENAALEKVVTKIKFEVPLRYGEIGRPEK